VEPQSGNAYHFLGAINKDDFLHLLLDSLPQPSERIIDGEFLAEHIDVRDEGATSFHLQLKTESAGKELTARLENLRRASKLSFCPDAFSVLAAVGKPIESALKVARQFYEQRGLKDPTMILVGKEKVENSQRFNPENGALLTEPRQFNLMFKTYVGPVEDPESVAYLRPETAQAIFAQFKNVLETSRQKVPFGVAQMGKAFRNEINPRNFTFRSREFEQMELEFFIRPDE